MAEVERGMEVADMKRLLVKSKVEPVNVAVGLDGKNAVMLLHKIKQPKAIFKDLQGKFDGLKNPRWGTAFVDTEADAKLVILTLNRSASGMGQKLKKTLKGTGFSKVRIQLEDGTVDEDIGEEEEEEEGGGQQAKAPAEEEAAAAAPPQAAAEEDAPAEQQAQTEEQPAFDPAALNTRLIALVKQMMEVIKAAPDRQAELKDLATKAQAALKGTDEMAAVDAVDALEEALEQPAEAGPTGAAAPQEAAANGGAPKNAAVLQKSRVAWVAARKRVEDEIGKLHQAMSKHYDGHGFATDLDKIFQSKVEPILTSLDQSLATKLDEVNKNTDPAQHEKLVGEAKQIIDRYESFLSGEKLISQLDENPFVPLQIQKTLTATLEALKKSVR